jgi:hypothetical protein
MACVVMFRCGFFIWVPVLVWCSWLKNWLLKGADEVCLFCVMSEGGWVFGGGGVLGGCCQKVEIDNCPFYPLSESVYWTYVQRHT